MTDTGRSPHIVRDFTIGNTRIKIADALPRLWREGNFRLQGVERQLHGFDCLVLGNLSLCHR